MNIVYAANDNYARHLGVSLCSLFDSNQDAPQIDVSILSMGISSASRRKLDAIAHRYGRRLHYVELDDLKQRIPFQVDTGRFDLSTLARLFLGEMLPSSVTRCIYLDCDTVVVRSLKHLWATPMGDMAASREGIHAVREEVKRVGSQKLGTVWEQPAKAGDRPGRSPVAGAVQEPTIYWQVKEIIGLGQEDPYFNAGMLLVDLAAWRREHLGQQMLDYYEAQGGRLPANDQDVINRVLKGRIRSLPPKYNFFPNYRYFSYKALTSYAPVYRTVTKKQFIRAKRRPVIIHYMGDERPWIAGNRNHYRRAYETYLARTGWAGTPKEKGKRIYMMAYHLMDYMTVLCPALRWEIGRRVGIRMLEGIH